MRAVFKADIGDWMKYSDNADIGEEWGEPLAAGVYYKYTRNDLF